MSKVVVNVKVISKNMPYEYSGYGELKKDLLFFEDNKERYLYDNKAEKLIKEKKDEKLTIDFVKEKITIESDDIELDFNISIVEKKKSEKDMSFYCKYKLDKEIIEFSIKILEG